MKKINIIIGLILLSINVSAQVKIQLAPNVSLGINRNVETYFFVEKLAVETMDNFVFNNKGTDYSHQPIVHYAFKHFQPYQNDPIILRSAAILKQIRDSLHDNAPILEYLLNQKEFPARGKRWSKSTGAESSKDDSQMAQNKAAHSKLQPLFAELTDSLAKFYIKADVGKFLQSNEKFYSGALQEVVKDIRKPSFGFMEKYYGQIFPEYQLYISPAMPITPGDDSYRGFGPQIQSAKGPIPSMMVSTSKMVPLQNSIADYKVFGFDNQRVTSFIFSHEILHSFVNPLLDQYASVIKADSTLYTSKLKEILSPHYIGDWYVCVIEHLTRLGEIRVAVAMGDQQEAERLRKFHIGEYDCVLLPLLEQKITEYEKDRGRYPTYKSYLPNLISYLHSLSPEFIDEQVAKYADYKKSLKK